MYSKLGTIKTVIQQLPKLRFNSVEFHLETKLIILHKPKDII